MKLFFYLLECVLLTSTPTPYRNEKIVIIVVQCDKKYAVSMCACPVAPYVSLLAGSSLSFVDVARIPWTVAY